MNKAILVNFSDNVATVTTKEKGEKIEILLPDGTVYSIISMLGSIPFGHKIAVKDLRKGMKVIKYGEVIGATTSEVLTGEWVHTHNLASLRVSTKEKVS